MFTADLIGLSALSEFFVFAILNLLLGTQLSALLFGVTVNLLLYNCGKRPALKTAREGCTLQASEAEVGVFVCTWQFDGISFDH